MSSGSTPVARFRLAERRREVLTRRYGRNNRHAESHEEPDKRLRVGEERSRQIERKAIHRLRSTAATPAGAAQCGTRRVAGLPLSRTLLPPFRSLDA